MKMNQQKFSLPSVVTGRKGRQPHSAHVMVSRRLWLALLVLLGGLLSPAFAQTRDVITFTGGAPDPNDPNIYVIDVGNVAVDEETWTRHFSITLQRPQGATATEAATIYLREVTCYGDDYSTRPTVTFAPTETEKTIDVAIPPYPIDYASGNLPCVFNVFAVEHAEAAYQVLVVKMNTPAQEWMELEECTLATPLEVLQTAVTDYGMDRVFRWGEYTLLRLEFTTPVMIQPDSRYVLQIRETDHTGLAIDADDWGQSKIREVELTPLNGGSVCTQALFLYRPTDDELLNFLHGDGSVYDQTFRYDKSIYYHVLEAGPFEVANPMEGGIKYISFSRTDMENAKEYCVAATVEAFHPMFSDVSINKKSFKSGETMVITAKMDNWPLVKRMRQEDFIYSLGVTFDGSETIEQGRASFNEVTGTLTCSVTAPTVSSSTNLQVDFGAIATVWGVDEWENETEVQKVIPGPEGSFTVNVSSEAAPEVHAMSIDFAGLPPDGSAIIVNTTEYGDFVWRSFPLAISFLPTNATDASEVTYSVENMGGAEASIGDYNGQKTLYTENEQGTITVKATLPSGVSTQRTYLLWVSPPEGVHHTNSFPAGTTFTQFEFEIKNDIGQVKNDKVTINYTHANGTTWTETHQFSQLKHRRTDAGTTCYMVPFNFTEDHPEPTSDQIDKPIITATAVMEMAASNGATIPIEATATLMAELKRPSFDDYRYIQVYYTEARPASFTTTVMYLPRKGFTVGYLLPDINVEQTYSNLSGDPVPDWLTLEEDGEYYYTAHINAKLDLNGEDAYTWLYTMAQRSYIPDEAMERHLTRWCQFQYATAENNIIYRVNRQDVSGDLTFDNSTDITAVTTMLKANGFISKDNATDFAALEDVFNKTKAYFAVYDDFDGADVTLTREGEAETLSTLSHYKGTFAFAPPADGRTYIVDVYYPTFDKHYKSTFVSHPLAGVRSVSLYMNGSSDDYTFSYTNNGNEYAIPFSSSLKGYIYVEDADAFYLQKEGEDLKPRFVFPEEFQGLVYNNTPELYAHNEFYSSWPFNDGSVDSWSPFYLSYIYRNPTSSQPTVTLRWADIIQNSTLITLIDSKGQPVTNATINYACVDQDLTHPTAKGSAGYNSTYGGYQVETDPGKYAELMEVVVEGRQHPLLCKMPLWNYAYGRWDNRGKARRYTIVLQEDDEVVSQASLETLTLKGHYSHFTELNGYIKAENTPTNLLTVDKNSVLDYSETADYPNVRKGFHDDRFGYYDYRFPYKFARLSFNIHADNLQSTDGLKLVNSSGTVQLSPDDTYNATSFIDKNVFTTFSTNHWLLDFDLAEKIAEGATEKLKLVRNGNETLMELPALHNNSVDMAALTEQTTFDGELTDYDLTQADDEIENHGGTMNGIGRVFDGFRYNYSTPPTLPFRLNIERKDDYFLVRGIYEQNFLSFGGITADMMDAAEYAEWFEDQFRESVNAVNNKRNDVENRLREMKKMTSGFAGIKGYISGIGYYNPETKRLDVNFYDGGIIMETSVHLMGKVSIAHIAQFGISIDAGAFATLGLLNRAAAQGDVASKPLIDMITETRFNLTLGAWAEVGFDAKIVAASIGVMGSAGIDIRTGTVTPTYQQEAYAGSSVSFDFNLSAYVTGRFFFWGGTTDFTLLEGHKTFYDPNNSTNPYHPSFKLGEPIFSMSRQNVTKNFKKLSRKTRRALDGTSLFDNVSGMAQPTYLLGGQSLLFNNLKSASNYNDDRLQVYSNGSKSDLVSTGFNAPMYDFVEAHNSSGMEVVAFEQIKEPLHSDELDVMEENAQIKDVTEKSEIHVAMRQNGGAWTTEAVGTYWGSGIGCVTPAVAVQDDGKAAVIWQQGVAKFSNRGERYIDGSLMLSRYDGSSWGNAIEIKRLNSRSMPTDYQVTMNGDEVLVVMTLQQDVNNPTKRASVVYVTIGSDDKVRERYTQAEGSKPQMVNIGGTNLVTFMEYTDKGRELRLVSVDMKGEPTGKLNGKVGMLGRMVNDYRLVADDNATDLSDVALLWSQSDEETTDNGDGTATVEVKNRIYASKLCSEEQQIYFSSPVVVADIGGVDEQIILASMDGYLDGLDMKVAFSVANFSDAASVREASVAFTNDIDHTAHFNPYDVNSAEQVPVTITVENKGYEPIDRVDVTMGGNTTSYDVKLMPMGKTELKVHCPVGDDFDGTISYDVTANFVEGNSNALRSRRLDGATRPHRIQQSGTQVDVRQVDMALKVLSKKTDADGVMTIVAEVNNVSLLPLASDMSVKVGLYTSPVVDQNAVSQAEVTVSSSDLYNATAVQKNKVKVVTLTVPQPEQSQTLYLCTKPVQNGEVIKDVKPSNNVLPVYLMGKDDHAVATHLDNVQVAGDNTVIYNTSGVRQNSMSKGVNIVVKGGQARKVIQGK